MTTWIRWFDDVGMNDVPVVGGKNAGIDSLSLNPDSQLKTMLEIAELEKALQGGHREAAATSL